MTVKMHDRVKEGLWGPGMPPFLRLAGKTIGFVGFGNIGKALCKMTNGISMKPIVYDPFVSGEAVAQYGAEKMELDELLAKAVEYNGINLIRLEGEADQNVLRQVPAILRTKFPEGKCALVGATQQDGKPMISVVLSQALVDAGKNAGQIIKSAAKNIQGGGGGQAWMATAGGRNVDGLKAAMDEMLVALQ